jgi:primosomal protein N' (replication factor Y) (superfamily II helicase)
MTFFYRVAVPLHLPFSSDSLLDYVSPTPLPRGSLVEVMVKQYRTLGIVWSETAPSVAIEKLKPIEHDYNTIILSEHERQWIEKVSAYYHQALGCMAHLALPPDALKYFKKPPRSSRPPTTTPSLKDLPPIILTSAQQSVVDAIMGPQLQTPPHFQVHLIHGITGSGKTEVYRTLARHVLEQGQQVLWLIPEIKLTPQLLTYLAPEWAEQMVALHSHLTPSQRFKAWQRARTGEAQLIIGTRLAVFTPLPRLGLIIVDEEHDASFSQYDQLRYHGRDTAILRAKHQHCPIILGSATPSLESYVNATQKGVYTLHTLTERAIQGAQLPAIRLVAPREKTYPETTLPWSESLDQALVLRLQRQEQSLIFINRRGYAPTLYCAGCDWMAECKACSARLVWHKEERRLRCHHCGAQHPIPKHCPQCGHLDIFPMGFGTQHIEEALRTRFPEARILRVDQDSMRLKRAWESALKAIANEEIDILVGTQMLAKGHHFPRLSLVGILGTDDALYCADYRAAETVFAQLLQVAGRAGRAEYPGEVFIETHHPDHPLFQCLITQDYVKAAEGWMHERQQHGLPPFRYWALFWAESKQRPLVTQWMRELYAHHSSASPLSEIHSPMPALMEKKVGWYRYYMLIQSEQRSHLHHTLKQLEDSLHSSTVSRHIRWRIDVDPLYL